MDDKLWWCFVTLEAQSIHGTVLTYPTHSCAASFLLVLHILSAV